jgi:hypothetical protein
MRDRKAQLKGENANTNVMDVKKPFCYRYRFQLIFFDNETLSTTWGLYHKMYYGRNLQFP